MNIFTIERTIKPKSLVSKLYQFVTWSVGIGTNTNTNTNTEYIEEKCFINIKDEYREKFPYLKQLYELDPDGILEVPKEIYKDDILDGLDSPLGEPKTFPGLYMQHFFGAIFDIAGDGNADNIDNMVHYPVDERIFRLMKTLHQESLFVNIIKNSLYFYLSEGKQFHTLVAESEGKDPTLHTLYNEINAYYTMYFHAEV